jgi:hypothetical protein
MRAFSLSDNYTSFCERGQPFLTTSASFPPARIGPPEGELFTFKIDKQLTIAADYIQKSGYRRRDEDLAKLQAVLRGEPSTRRVPDSGYATLHTGRPGS